MFIYQIVSFTNFCIILDECSCDHDGRGTGVRDPADHHWKTAFRSGGQDDRSARSLVFWTPIY